MNMMRVSKRKKERKRNWPKALVALLAMALFLSIVPAVVQADKSEDGLVTLPNGDHGKREVVYAKLDAAGAVEQVFVVNHFHPTSATTLTDYGDYDSVIQLTGDVSPVLDGSQVTMEGVEGRYFYQGNLNSTALPWHFDILYRFEGEDRSAERLSGVTGKLEMEISISKNDAVNDVFFDHYALQIAIPVDPDRVVVEAATEGFLVSSAGTEQQLNYIILPGQDKTIRLVMDVNDFAMGQITFGGVLMSFDIDALEMDDELEPIDELTDGIAEFADGTKDLKKGFAELKKAFIDIRDGGTQLVNSGYQLEQGVNELTAGAEQLLQEGQGLKTGSEQLLGGLSAIIANLPPEESLALPEMPNFDQETLQALAMLDPQLAGQIQGMLELFGSYAPMLSQYSELANALKGLEAGYKELHGGLGQYVDQGVGGVVGGLKGTETTPGLSTGLSRYVAGVSTFKKGLDDYYSSGLVEFSNGLDKLVDGAGTMRDETAGMKDKFEGKIEEMLDEFSHNDFKPVSFVSEKNEDVASVQFVFMTDEIPPVDTK